MNASFAASGHLSTESKRRGFVEKRTAALVRLGERKSPRKAATILKQYELIRAEVIASMQVQQQILGFGIATIGLLAGAAFVGKNDAHRSDLLIVFVPLISYLAVTIWFSEVMRMLRAGAFMLTLEKRLDDCGDGSLEWEYRVARGRLRYPMWKPYFGVLDPDQLRLIAVTLLFLTLAAASIVLGWADASNGQHVFAVVAGVIAVIVLLLLFQLRLEQLGEILGTGRDTPSLTRLRARFRRPRRTSRITSARTAAGAAHS
jgi:hypothetical protein